jgi:flagellar biosynthesis protein FliP
VRAVLTRGLAVAGLVVCILTGSGLVLGVAGAYAAPGDPPAVPTGAPGVEIQDGTNTGTTGPTGPTGPGTGGTSPDTQIQAPLINVDGKPSNSIMIILALTVLSVAPALLLLCTSFTKIFVVLSITRNALGLTTVPPNQVIAGLALFLSLFVMGPVLTEMNRVGLAPLMRGDDRPFSVVFQEGTAPLRSFMAKHTRQEDLALIVKAADAPKPKDAESTDFITLIPAFILSELRAALIIGFAIYIPFLVIDMVVSASLMSMGMMMLPPVTVSLPFKLLLFVLANGWGLVVTSLVASYR